jgi:hypothetical protein
MTVVELNPVGNFESWDTSKLKELQSNEITEILSPNLLFDNENLKLWEISLLPNERIPFRRCKNSYSITAMTNGVALTRIADGSICLIRLKKGESDYLDFQDYNHICDFENIGEEPIKLSVTEFKT